VSSRRNIAAPIGIYKVVAILRRQPGQIGLRDGLRSRQTDHAEPLLVDLHEAPERIVYAEGRVMRAPLRRAHTPQPLAPPRRLKGTGPR
jgi:hypothetical protein